MHFHLVGRWSGMGQEASELTQLGELGAALSACGANQVTLDQSAEALIKIKDLPEDAIIIVFGGDGTMLTCAKLAAPRRILGINRGRLGFITDIDGNFDPIGLAEELVAGNFRIEERSMLIAKDNATDTHYGSFIALNDIVIRSANKIIELEITVNDRDAFAVRGDGLIIATPTGSTAYNLSAGGPIIHPNSGVYCLTPLNPQSLSNRPIIIPNELVVRISIRTGNFAGVADITADGIILNGDFKTIAITNSPIVASFLHLDDERFRHDYFNSLRSKLNWFLPPK